MKNLEYKAHLAFVEFCRDTYSTLPGSTKSVDFLALGTKLAERWNALRIEEQLTRTEL
jgi:hypothetical protein